MLNASGRSPRPSFRYHAVMQQRNVARELGLVVASIGVLVHWLDPVPALIVTFLISAAAAAGTGPTCGEWRPWRMPLIPGVLAALAAFSIGGIARIVSPMPWLILDFAAGWAVVAWVVSLETAPDVLVASDEYLREKADRAASAAAAAPKVRLRAMPRAEFDLARIVAEPVVIDERDLPPHPRPGAVKFAAIGLAFLGFVAAGGLVPDGLALDRHALHPSQLAFFGVLTAGVAGAVGYRLAALASPDRTDRIVRIVACGEYALPVAGATLILRTMGLPRLFIPALLTMIVYVITQLRDTTDEYTEGAPLIQELALLGLVAVSIMVWGYLIK